MEFEDWFAQPERATEIEEAMRDARRDAEDDQEFIYFVAASVMRVAWDAACVACLEQAAEAPKVESRPH